MGVGLADDSRACFLIFWIMNASSCGILSSKNFEPEVVRIPFVSYKSFTAMGMPYKGMLPDGGRRFFSGGIYGDESIERGVEFFNLTVAGRS